VSTGDEQSVYPRFFYDDCACTFSVDPTTATVDWPNTGTVNFSLVSSQDPDLYGATGSCAVATITQDTSSDVFTLSGRTGTIEAPSASDVGSTGSLTFSWAAPTEGSSFSTTVGPMEVRPACAGSNISFTTSFEDQSVPSAFETTITIPSADYYH